MNISRDLSCTFQSCTPCAICCMDFQNGVQTVGLRKWNHSYSDVKAVWFFHHEKYSQVRFICCLVQNLYLLYVEMLMLLIILWCLWVVLHVIIVAHRHDGVVAWWRGGVVAWWRGGVVAWWHGGMVAPKFSNYSYYSIPAEEVNGIAMEALLCSLKTQHHINKYSLILACRPSLSSLLSIKL